METYNGHKILWSEPISFDVKNAVANQTAEVCSCYSDHANGTVDGFIYIKTTTGDSILLLQKAYPNFEMYETEHNALQDDMYADEAEKVAAIDVEIDEVDDDSDDDTSSKEGEDDSDAEDKIDKEIDDEISSGDISVSIKTDDDDEEE